MAEFEQDPSVSGFAASAAGRAFDRSVFWMRRFMEGCAIGLTLSFVVVVLMAVYYRYVLNDSLVWTEEFIRFTLFWLVLIGAALVALENGHLRIEVVQRIAPEPVANALESLARLCTIAFCVILAWQTYELFGRTTGTSPALRFPMRWVYAAMIFGGIATIIGTVHAWLWRRRHEMGDLL